MQVSTLWSLARWKNMCIWRAPAVTGLLHLLHSPRTLFLETLKWRQPYCEVKPHWLATSFELPFLSPLAGISSIRPSCVPLEKSAATSSKTDLKRCVKVISLLPHIGLTRFSSTLSSFSVSTWWSSLSSRSIFRALKPLKNIPAKLSSIEFSLPPLAARLILANKASVFVSPDAKSNFGDRFGFTRFAVKPGDGSAGGDSERSADATRWISEKVERLIDKPRFSLNRDCLK